MSRSPRHRRPLIEALEPRLLFSATADIAVFDDGTSDGQYLAQAAEQVDLVSIYMPSELLATASSESPVTTLIFVDPLVEDYEVLVNDILQNHPTSNIQIIYLDADTDGIAQITESLAGFSQIDSLHIISHGAPGAIALGNTLLSNDNISSHETELTAWRNALSEDADILVYGCDVAAGVAGQQLVTRIASLTGADIAASENTTGHSSLRGDWQLEFVVGDVEHSVLVSTAAQENWVNTFATTQYINIQGGSSSQAVSSATNVGQSFLVDNGGAPYTINQISVQLMRAAGAANQDITIHLLDGGWGDASPLVSRVISFDKLTTELAWKTINFNDVVLNSGQTYIIRITSSNADGNVSVAYSNTNRWNSSEMIVSGVGNANADLNLLVGYNNGTNQASVNTVPGPQSTGQNTSLVFSAANGNQIQIADADAFPNAMEVTLSGNIGFFSLAQTTGLTFIGGDGTSDYYMRFQGSINAINAALATITYTPSNNVIGDDTFSISTKDLGLNSVETVSNIAIAVNHPLNTVPGAQSVNEDTPLQFSQANGNRIQVADPGIGMDTSNVKVTLSVSNGLLTLGSMAGVTFTSGDGTSDALLVFNGSLVNINAALATITFTPTANYNGSTSLTILTEGSSSGGPVKDSDSINITVNSVNDAPTVANPISNQTMTEGSALNYVMPANTFNDVDGGSLSYVATLSGGQALPVWLQFNSATRTFSGVPDDGDVGILSIRVTATDGGGLSVYDDFNLTINNLPERPFVVNPIPDQVASGFTQFTYTFASDVFADPDVGGSIASYRATLADGSALPGWLSFNSATRTFSGIPSNADAGTISIRLYATDNTGLESTTPDQFNITTSASVNDAPVNTVPGAQSTNEDTALVFNLANGNRIQIADADAISGSVQVTLGVSNGVLTLAGTAGLSFTTGDGTNDATLVFTGTVANINAALATLTYTPTGNYNGADTLSIVTNDQGNSGTGGAKIDSDTVAITVNAVNDAPVNTVPLVTQTATEDTAFVFSSGNGNQIQINDADAGSSSMQVTLSVTNGTLTLAGVAGLSFTTGDGTADSSLVFSGTRAAINTALATLTFNPTANYNGAAVLSLTSSDLGNTGSGGTKTDSDTVNITINAANDAPTAANIIPNQNATEDAAFNFQFAANTFNDIDAATTLVYSAQLAGGGALPSWLSFNAATRTFSGTPLNANVGTVSIDVIASDGSGGTVTDTFDIVVANTNDAPTVANAIPNQNATEDAAFNFTFDVNIFADQDAASSLTYSAQLAGGGALPAWLIFNDATRTFSGTPLNANVGTVSIDVIASDGLGGTVSDTFDIVIANTNDPPTVANAIPDQNATEDVPFNFSFASNTFNDPDLGSILTYSAELDGGGALPAWLSFDPGTRTFSGTPTNTDVDIDVKVIASDGTLSVSDSFNISITNTPDAPYLAIPIPNQNATEGVLFNFPMAVGTFFDPDGDVLTYTATMANGSPLTWLSFDPATQTFSGTPANGDVGTISIKVTADDGDSTVATGTFDIVIANTNDTPTVLNPISNQNATEDSAFNFTFASDTFTDQDVGNTLVYTAQLAGGGLLPAWLIFDAGTRTFSGTPLNAHVGTVSIDVIASDGNGGTVTDTFNIVIANSNDAPTIANPIGDQNATEDAAFNFQFAVNTFADVDASTTLTYSAQLSGGGALPAWLNFDSATRTFSGTPTNGDVGTLSIDVTANDGNGGTVTDTFDIVIANSNDAPTVVITPTDYNAIEQVPIDLHGTGISVADVDGDALTITLTAAGSNSNLAAIVGTTGVVIVSGVNTNTLILSGTAAQLNDLFAGNNGSTLTYRLSGDTPVATRLLTISASDGSLSGNDTATINITAVNDGPENEVPGPGAQLTNEDTALVFSAANGNQIQIDDLDAGSSDLEVTLSVTNGTLTLAGVAGLAFTTGDGTADSSLVFRGTQSAINTALAALTFNPTANFNGAAVLTITTSDLGNTGSGGTLTDSDNISITINPDNDAPTVANAIPNQNAIEDSAFNFQFAVGAFADADADSLTYTVQLAGGGLLPAWLSFDAVTRTFSGTPGNGDVGTLSIEVTADDGNTSTVTDTFDIVIANSNDAPTIANPIANQNATEDAAFNFQFAANVFADIDVGNTLTYTAQLAGGGSLPTWLSFDAVTRTFSGTPANGDVGTVSIDVIADDGNGGTVTDTFNIVVGNTNDAPSIANAIADQAATEDSAFNFQFALNTFADADVGATLAYSAQLAGGGALPTWLSFDAVTRTFSGTPANGDVGTVSIDVIADDGNGGTVTDTFDIVIANSNDAPTVANVIPNQNATEDAAFNFQFALNTFADVDVGDTLTYTAQLAGGGSLPTWLSFDAVTRTFSGTPANGDVGTVSIDVIADDGSGGTVTDTFNIVVGNTNDAPIIANVIPNQNATEDAAFNFQFAANTFADIDVGATLTYSVQLAGGGALPAWLSFDAVTRTFSGTPANGDVGTVSIDVIADDGNGGTVTDTFNIVIANSNDVPTVANAIPNQNAAENSVFNFQFAANTFNDIDVSNTLTYSVQLAGGGGLPAWLSFDALTRTFSGVPATSDTGTLNIDVIANDGNGGTVTDTFSIIVSGLPDTEYIDTGIGGAFNPVSSANQVGQSFSYNSAGPTYTVNEISLYLARYDAAAPQTITVELRDAWNGAVLASDSIPSSQISRDGFGWHSFNFSDVVLNDQQTYVIQISSTGTDDLVLVSRIAGNTYTDGAMIENGVPNASGWDLAFKIAKDDGNNTAPVLDNPITDQAIDAELPFNLVVPANTFSDPDPNDTITYRAQLAGGGSLGWLTFNEATKTFAGTPHWHQAGTMTVELIATDNHGASTSAFFDIEVTNTNTAPTVANPIPDQATNEDAPFSFQFAANTFADVDVSNTFTYSAELAVLGGLPPWLSFDAATRTFSGTPANVDVGTWTVEVTANDGFGGEIIDTFVITVVNTNDAPTLANPIPDRTATQGSAFNFQFAANTFSDIDAGNTLTYSAQLNGGGALPAWLTFDAATRTFSGTPANGDVGSLAIEVIANDGNGSSISDIFTLVVNNINDAPTVANPIVDQNATEDIAFNFQFAANVFADIDVGDTLAYTAQLAGGGALPAWLSFDPVTRTFSGTPANGDVGTVSIDVIADDGNGGTVTDTFNIIVANTNDAPTVANPIADQNATEDVAFNFQFSANTFADIDAGNTLTYSAQLNGGGALPAWLSFDAATRTFSGTPANGDVGTITLDVIASDGQGGAVTETFAIVIANTNDAPTVANPIADQNATEDVAFNFQFTANTFADIDAGNTLTYSAQLNGGGALPTWLSFDSATRTFSGTPANGNVGTITLDVIANDGQGGTVTETFAIVIANTNDAPTVANPIADQNATEDSPFGFTLPVNTFVDVENNSLVYSAQLFGGGALPAWLNFDAATRTFSGIPADADVGSVAIEVSVSDGNGGIASDVFVINVTNTNEVPVLVNPPANQTAQEDIPFTVNFGNNMFADVDNPLTYTAQLANGDALPGWLIFDAANVNFSGIPTNSDAGVLSIRIIASDGVASANAQFQLTVIAVNDAPVSSGLPVINNGEDANGDTVNLFAAFSDEESAANQMQYSVVSNSNPALVSGATIDSSTGTLQLRYGANQFGSADLVIRAQDSQGAMVETLLRVNIESVNDTPTSTGIADIHVQAGAVAQQMNLHRVFNDIEDGAQLQYSLMGNSNPAVATNIQIDSVTGMMTLAFSSSAGGESIITLRVLDAGGAWIDTHFKITVTAADTGIVVPPIVPPVTPAEPALPIIPPTEPPIAEIPVTEPGGSQPLLPTTPDDSIESNLPGMGNAGNVISNDDDRTEFAYVNDQSSRDYARAAEMLNSGNVPLTTLTASTSLVSLITPDAGFAPWEAEDFDNEVRRVRAQMDEAMEEEQDRKAMVAGLTFSVTTGLLVWSLRASSLLLTMMSMLPLWRGLDPLPILDEVNKKKKELEQQRKDREREDKSAKEVGYLFDHAQNKESQP